MPTKEEYQGRGYQCTGIIEATLPMPVWELDLEIEQQREVTAAELAVMKLIDGGVPSVDELAVLLGLGTDRRLVEKVVVRLLAAGALDVYGIGFVVTGVGRRWITERLAPGRRRETFEVRIDPASGALEWVDQESPVRATPTMWTIELAPIGREVILDRKAEVGVLVRAEGLPDDDGPDSQRRAVELRSFAVVSSRVHWRRVEIELWQHPIVGDVVRIGYVDGAENPPLSRLIEHHVVFEGKRTLAIRHTSSSQPLA